MMAGLGGLIRRHGLKLIAVGAFIGIALPGLASAMRPWLVLLSIGTMMVALLRIEPADFGAVLRRPLLAIIILAWVTVVVPLMVWLALRPVLPAESPFLAAAVLIAGTPSVMSASAFAILLGADGALLTVVGIPSNALAPAWLPMVASIMGVGAQVDPLAMAQRLAVLVGGSFAAALLAVRVFGRPAIRRAGPALDSWVVLLITISAIPCMDGVGPALMARPVTFAGMLAFALGLNMVLQVVGYLVFQRAPVAAALSAALVTGSRNNVLLLAAIGAPGDGDLSLIISAAQLTLFIMPSLVAPTYRAIARRRG